MNGDKISIKLESMSIWDPIPDLHFTIQYYRSGVSVLKNHTKSALEQLFP